MSAHWIDGNAAQKSKRIKRDLIVSEEAALQLYKQGKEESEQRFIQVVDGSEEEDERDETN